MRVISLCAVILLGLGGCSALQPNVSRCIYGPANLTINVGAGPSNGMFMVELKEGGVYSAVAENQSSVCPAVPVP